MPDISKVKQIVKVSVNTLRGLFLGIKKGGICKVDQYFLECLGQMARREQLNSKERASIVALIVGWKSIHEISELTGFGQATVALRQHRFYKTGDVEWKAGSVRPRKTNQEEDQRILAAVAAKPITTAAVVTEFLLSALHAECRLNFSMEFWPKEDYFGLRSIFTDEKTFG